MEFLDKAELQEIVDEQVVKTTTDSDDEIEKDLDDWVEDADDDVQIKSLFNHDHLASVDLLVTHDLDLFKFDLKSTVSEHCTDDISVIKLINFIRSAVATQAVDGVTQEFVSLLIQRIEGKEFLQNDDYMMPVLEDDPLLYLYEETLLTVPVECD